MPLLLAGASALVVGTLLGTAEAGVWAAAIAVAMACSPWRRTLGPLGALAALAAFDGERAAADARRCRGLAARERQWAGTLDLSPAAPGDLARGVVHVGTCEVFATLVVAHGAADAGANVWVFGRATETPRGIAVLAATVVPRGGADWRMRARARASAQLERLFGPSAPLARALLVADTRDLSQALKDRFADSGLIHALSISGLHVAIVAQALTLLFGMLRAPPAAAALAGLAATCVYVAWLGAPPPAVRAGVMLGVPAVAKALQRPVSSWAAVAWGSALPVLLDPLAVQDIGYHLSVGGMAGLICAGAWARRVVAAHEHRLPGWRGTLVRELLTGAAVAVLTGPLSAWHVGRLSVVAPVTNVIAGPVVALLQPALFVTLAVAPLAGVAELAAAGTVPLLAAFDWIAELGARVPGAAFTVTPGVGGAVATGLAVVALGAAAMEPAWTWRAGAVAAASLAVLAWQPLVAPPAWTELHVFDVGQGDGLGIRTRRGRWILIDGGPAGQGRNAARSAILPALRRRGGTVEVLVVTHPDLDHVGGAPLLVDAVRPRLLLEPAYPGTSDAYRETLQRAAATGTRWRAARAGDSLVVDEVTLRILAPDSAMAADAHGPNDASVVLMAEVGDVRWLLTGDAEVAEEAWLAHRWGDALAADVYKVGHHGSRTSSTPPLLARTRPVLALVSVGRRNRYGHPDPDVLATLVRGGATVLRTDRLGPLVVRTDGERLEAMAAGERWPVERRRPPR